MKKILILFAAIMYFASVPMAEAKKPMPEDVPQIGFNILQANNIQKRMVFKSTTQIRHPRAEFDYKPKNTGLDVTGRIIWVYGDVFSLVDDENEMAGLLSYAVAVGENSYKGIFQGFFSNFTYSLNPRPKENKFDIKAVDYMVKAGYNPVALITVYNKTLAQTRYEWCHFYPLATKRMVNIYEHIYKKYPQYLTNNVYENNIYYKNFLSTTGKEMKKIEKKLNK